MSFADLDPAVLQQRIATAIIGNRILHQAQVASTNPLVAEAARAGHPEGLVILAEEQTAGRGRMGRGWSAPPGSSLLLSILLRPPLPPAEAFTITMLAGTALCEAVEQTTPLRPLLKWPNDLVFDTVPGQPPRKAAGILSDIEVADRRITRLIVGMGVNVNWTPVGEIDGVDLSRTAISLRDAAGQDIDRAALLCALLEALDRGYAAACAGDSAGVFAAWRARLHTLGTPVRVTTPAGLVVGTAEDVEPGGALVVRGEHGERHVIPAGDVHA